MVHFVFEVLLNIDYWVGYLDVNWSSVISYTVVVSYGFTMFGTLSALITGELWLIDFPIPSVADYLISCTMPITCVLFSALSAFVYFDESETYFFPRALLSATLWLPATAR